MGDRHTDMMRQGFLKGSPVPKPTAAQKRDAKERADRILARLDARSPNTGDQS